MKLEATDIRCTVNGRRIVDGASLSVSAGEFVGLVGPNGAGKSSLLKAILGIRPRDVGTVTIDGGNFFALSPRERARRVAFLPQERHVEWRLPGRDIVMLGRFPHHTGFGGASAADNAAVDRALAAVEAGDVIDRPVAVLSGGERTRILLARALAVEAPILLVDEPTDALDPYHQIHVMEILHGLSRRGVGVLAVLHDLALASRFMDRLILLDDGAVAADGAPNDVLSPELLETVYRIDAIRGTEAGRPWVLPWSRKETSAP